MTKDILITRIQELSNAITESSANFQRVKAEMDNIVNNHNSLIGRLEEAKELHQKIEKSESIVGA